MDEHSCSRPGAAVMATARMTSSRRPSNPSADLLPAPRRLTILALVGNRRPARPTREGGDRDGESAGSFPHVTGYHASPPRRSRGASSSRRAITGAAFGAFLRRRLDVAIDDVGLIARVTPEHKVRLGPSPRSGRATSSR